MKKSKLAFKYESERLPYLLARHYIPDFVITLPSGNKVFLEVKGYLRPEHKAKMVAVKKLHPTIDLRILFYAHSIKNIRWAEKHRIKWAVGTIPKDWFDEVQVV